MKKVGLILCRAGSKGLPGKNKLLLRGKHVFAYQVKNLKDAGISEVYVSTNDKDIKNMSKLYDFHVIDRPEELCKDTSKCEEAIKHFTDIIEYDVLVFAQATSPMCPPKYIAKGLEIIDNNKADSVVSVVEDHWLPRWDKQMNPVDWDPARRPRRQDRESFYMENGAFYITKRENFIKSGIRYSGRILPIVMPIYDSMQIDTKEELEMISRIIKDDNS